MAEFGEVFGILCGLVGWFEGCFGFHVHSEGWEGWEGVFRVVTLRSFPDKVIDVAVKVKLLSPGCILYAPSEDNILDPRMGSLEQFEELDIPHPHYSRDPGGCHFFSRGTPSASASVAIERGYMHWIFTECGPHGKSKTWKHFTQLEDTS